MGKFLEASFGASQIGEVYPKYLGDLHGRLAVGAGSISATDMSVTVGEENVYPLNMTSWMETAALSNPYTTVEAYDPDTDITSMYDVLADLQTTLDALDEDADFAAYMAVADTAFAAYGVDTSDDGDAEITAHAARMKPELNAARARFLASMFEMNTVNTSFHTMGLAYLETEHLWRLEDFRAKLKLTSNDSKNRFLIAATEMMYVAQARKHDFLRNNTLASLDFYRTKIQTKAVEVQQNLQWDTADINWEATVISTASGIIGAMQGVPSFPKQPSDLQQGIANALSVGPQIGMSVGQATGNPGAGMLAAVIGGGLGFLGGQS